MLWAHSPAGCLKIISGLMAAPSRCTHAWFDWMTDVPKRDKRFVRDAIVELAKRKDPKGMALR